MKITHEVQPAGQPKNSGCQAWGKEFFSVGPRKLSVCALTWQVIYIHKEPLPDLWVYRQRSKTSFGTWWHLPILQVFVFLPAHTYIYFLVYTKSCPEYRLFLQDRVFFSTCCLLYMHKPHAGSHPSYLRMPASMQYACNMDYEHTWFSA